MKLILLDRDGVINKDSEHYIKTPEEWVALPGSLEAIARLNRAGFKVAIATNQSGIARGLFTLETLNQIHKKIHHECKKQGGHIDHIFYCPHGPKDNCECRKPKPGLLHQAFKHFCVAPHDTCFIGDSIRDIQAANTAGCHSALVLTGNGKKTTQEHEIGSTPLFDDLSHFVTQLLQENL